MYSYSYLLILLDDVHEHRHTCAYVCIWYLLTKCTITEVAYSCVVAYSY